MSQLSRCLVAFLAIVSAILVQGQSNPATTCQTATGMSNANASLFSGSWYEEFRSPAKNISCVKILVDVVNNQTQLNIKTMYSASQTGLLMDKNSQAKVNISEVNSNAGFNVSYSTPNAANTTYKILSTDYITNVVLCGFTNASDSSTSFGIIMTREQIVNSTWLMEVKNNASKILSAFSSNTAGNITQSKSCSTSSATTAVPVLATLFATFYALLKLVN